MRRLPLHLVPAGEDRPRLAIETARRWAKGDPTVTWGDVRNAADAAYAAADAADAAYVAAADDATTTYATYAADRTVAVKTCADIVRKHFRVVRKEGK